MFTPTPVSPPPDENSNQSFLSDVYQPKMDNSSSTSSSQQVSPPHTSSLRTEDSQPPMLGQESVDGKWMKGHQQLWWTREEEVPYMLEN